MTRFLLICLAGAIGTGTRYLVSLAAAKWLPLGFPFGTLTVNVVGCFLIASVMQAALMSSSFSDTLRLTLTTGFMGGLTTYSSFNFETTKFFREGAWATGATYLLATFVGCLLAGLAGTWAAARVFATD
ncbi:MAG TPA: CrcB family protein [Labilithrix sp.]